MIRSHTVISGWMICCSPLGEQFTLYSIPWRSTITKVSDDCEKFKLIFAVDSPTGEYRVLRTCTASHTGRTSNTSSRMSCASSRRKPPRRQSSSTTCRTSAKNITGPTCSCWVCSNTFLNSINSWTMRSWGIRVSTLKIWWEISSRSLRYFIIIYIALSTYIKLKQIKDWKGSPTNDQEYRELFLWEYPPRTPTQYTFNDFHAMDHPCTNMFKPYSLKLPHAIDSMISNPTPRPCFKSLSNNFVRDTTLNHLPDFCWLKCWISSAETQSNFQLILRPFRIPTICRWLRP